ncbi:MAG: AAA family ATPase [Candidatus Dadabacteria bacterium]|nr:AAA family ATPase [Candidatus Dadabacteria bacterium]
MSDYVVLCVPILIDHGINTWLQLIKVKEYDHFYDHDIEFVIKVANILAPLLRKDVKDTEISNLSERALLEKSLREKYDFSNVIGHNNKMIELLDLVTKVMDVDVPVLIEGESGTGKELIARAIHYNSRRKKHLMISVNCGAIPENLLESEFFGHEKGAFTGASSKKIGQFEVANNGTIFLDEIGALNLTMQVKLLRVLQWNEFTPVGGILPKKVDVRVIAATNQKFSELVELKKFREDLYYRLNVLRLSLPPLRERKDDIPALCQYLIEKNCVKMGKTKMKISPDAMDTLMNYDFPGNVRELENIIQRAIILCESSEINYAHLPFEVKMNGKKAQKINVRNETFKTAKQRVIEEFEKQYITKKLIENRGIILRAAKKSGMYEANFRAKMNQYGIVVDDIFSYTDLNG